MATESTTNAMIDENTQGDGDSNATANDNENYQQPEMTTPIIMTQLATNGTVNNTQNGISNLNAQKPEIDGDDDDDDDEAEDDEENDDGN